MEYWQEKFLEEAENFQVLSFGEFKLKSERISPYFFNIGNFANGVGIRTLCTGYADQIIKNKIEFDVLFGAAYKGIPIVACLSYILAEKYKMNKAYCFNRKEVKSHGEGGLLIGATEYINTGVKVLIIDDVITAGTSINECLGLLKKLECTVVGVMVAIDRQEVIDPNDPKKDSVITRMQENFGFPIYSITNLNLVVEYLNKKVKNGQEKYKEHLERMKEYRSIYGSTN